MCSAFDAVGLGELGWCKPPRGQVAPSSARTEADIASHKWRYLQFARAASYAMPARALYWSISNAVEKLFDSSAQPEHEESVLGGRFLRMYLDQKLDAELIQEACVAIGGSRHFAALQEDVAKGLQLAADAATQPLVESEVRATADRVMSRKVAKGLEWRGEGLNPVIGGVGGLVVERAKLLSAQAGTTEREKRFTYELMVVVSDTYDFTNRRGGNYDRLRVDLASLLASNRFDEFEVRLGALGLDPTSKFIKKSGYDSLFAAFMYALEKRRWTGPGIAWKVTVPMSVSFVDRAGSARAQR